MQNDLLFKNKFRIKSLRLKNWDYSNAGWYFVTICTQNFIPYFGKINYDKVDLNEIGKIASKFWLEIPNHFPFVELDDFIIMPNHVHGIGFINENNNCNEANKSKQCSNPKPCRDAINRVSTKGGITKINNPMLNPSSLSEIIRQYKARSSFNIRKISPNFFWQSRFYEHIIHNEKSYNSIRLYIRNNPLKWHLDEYNLE